MDRDRKALLAVGAVLVLVQAGVLAAVAFPAPHSGGDNAGYLALAHALVEGAGYVELWDPALPPHTKYPPGYPLILALLVGAGATTWTTFKLASAAAISGATLAAFAWVSERRGALAAGALGLLLVLAAGWQEASRWILSEPWFLLWTFLALWAGDRGLGVEGQASDGRWLAAAGVCALLAFGIRTAGVPLVVAFLGALALARQWRAAVAFAVASAAVVGGWLLRTSRGGEGAYQSEFFLQNPYDPALGTVGVGGLLVRVWQNLRLYVGEVLPAQWWSAPEGWTAGAVGGILVALALAGWGLRLRHRAGPAELFAPLYGATILLWPEVWSGDRFLLPLLPLVVLYAGESAAALARRVAEGRGWSHVPVARGALAAGLLALSLPAVPSTLDRAAEGRECRARVEAAGDAFACHGPGFLEFRTAAAWMGRHLPDDAVALSRKPRILYTLGGPPGRTFPFTSDPDAFLEAADAVGASYLLLDLVDGMALRYMDPMVGARPGAFCHMATWQSRAGESGGTTLLGILPPDARGGADLERCPEGWSAGGEAEDPPVEGLRVPRLVAEGRGVPP